MRRHKGHDSGEMANFAVFCTARVRDVPKRLWNFGWTKTYITRKIFTRLVDRRDGRRNDPTSAKAD